MSHPERLQRILEMMSDGRLVTAAELAVAVSVSCRSVYRSIVILRREGHRIDGEAGMGYMLRSAK